jgi:hypothetical protein
MNGDETMKFNNGSESILTSGIFSQLIRIKNCPIENGQRRNVQITATRDTFFSVPGYINYKGKKISGFASYDDNGWVFIATGKHSESIVKADKWEKGFNAGYTRDTSDYRHYQYEYKDSPLSLKHYNIGFAQGLSASDYVHKLADKQTI